MEQQPKLNNVHVSEFDTWSCWQSGQERIFMKDDRYESPQIQYEEDDNNHGLDFAIRVIAKEIAKSIIADEEASDITLPSMSVAK